MSLHKIFALTAAFRERHPVYIPLCQLILAAVTFYCAIVISHYDPTFTPTPRAAAVRSLPDDADSTTPYCKTGARESLKGLDALLIEITPNSVLCPGTALFVFSFVSFWFGIFTFNFLHTEDIDLVDGYSYFIIARLISLDWSIGWQIVLPGIDVSCKANGLQIWYYAAARSKEVWSMILERTDDINLNNGSRDRPPLTEAIIHRNTELARLLLKRPVDTFIRDSFENMTAFEHAARMGNVEILKLLLQSDAKAQIANSPGVIAIAAKYCSVEVAELLYNNGADVNEEYPCWTAEDIQYDNDLDDSDQASTSTDESELNAEERWPDRGRTALVIAASADAALARAKELDEYFSAHGQTVDALHGLPITLKDHFHIKGLETSFGYVGWIGTFEGIKGTGKEKNVESELIRQLVSLGAVPIAKTTLMVSTWAPENNNNILGYLWNPYNQELSTQRQFKNALEQHKTAHQPQLLSSL
ncbi:general amidase GmdA [Cordyceps javanica]|nr:general amidase GmdA [Cordyceps javanica]